MSSPFDEAKYRALLDGLEVTEIDLNYVFKDNEHKRIDSEYFKKEFINFLLKTPKLKPLGAFVHQGYRVVYENTQIIDKGISLKKDFPIFLQATDLQTPFIKKDNLFHVDEAEWIRYPMGRIKKGELLIEVKGKIEKVSIVPHDFPEKVLVSGSLYKMTVKNINKYYLLTYLISSYGISLKDRNKTNLLISFLSKDDLYRIPVPVLNDDFQNIIEKLVRLSYKKIEESQTLYSQAETLLLEELGLKGWQPSEANTAEASFADSFLSSGRLDAEYYQPKYDELEGKFDRFERIAIGDLVNYPVSSGSTPKAGGDDYTEIEDGVPFVRAVDLINGEVSNDNFIFIKKEVHNGILKKTKLRQGDVLFSIAGTVGRCAIFQHDFEANINQAVSIIRYNNPKVSKQFLVVFFNSPIGKLFVEKYARQGLQTNLTLTEVASLRVPILPDSIQQQISNLVHQSQTAQSVSKRLLALAKEAVEVAIEQNEEAAEKLISSQIANNQ